MSASIYDSLIQADPQYAFEIGPIRQRRADLVTQFGSGAGVPGIDPSVAAAAAANPYSISQQLLHQYRGNLSGLGMDFNSRGGLFSGAYRHGVSQEADAANGRRADAYAQFQQGLSGINTDEANLGWSVYNRLAQNPPGIGDSLTPTAPTAAPVGPAVSTPFGSGSMAQADVIKPLHPYLPPAPTPRRPPSRIYSIPGL